MACDLELQSCRQEKSHFCTKLWRYGLQMCAHRLPALRAHCLLCASSRVQSTCLMCACRLESSCALWARAQESQFPAPDASAASGNPHNP